MTGTKWAYVAGGVVVVLVAAVVAVRVINPWCHQTFAYPVVIHKSAGQEDWRNDAAVLVDSEEHVVTRHHLVMDMALSPDGNRMVVAKGKGSVTDEYAGTEPTGLYTYDIDGSNEERLTLDSVGTYPDWSPDGEQVAYLTENTVRTVDVDDKEEREIFDLDSIDPGARQHILDLTWSPDSSQVGFTVGPYGDNSELWSVDADGSNAHLIRRIEGSVAGGLAWAPDGETFAWEGSYRGVPSLMIATADGEPRQVEPYAGDAFWSEDGSELAYVIGHEGHYDPRIVIGDSEGQGERAISVPKDASPIYSLEDWVSC